jgi:hypothetical protein
VEVERRLLGTAPLPFLQLSGLPLVFDVSLVPDVDVVLGG